MFAWAVAFMTLGVSAGIAGLCGISCAWPVAYLLLVVFLLMFVCHLFGPFAK